MGGLPEQEKAKVKRVNETIEKITRREPLSEEQLVPEEVKPEEVKPEPEVKEETPKEEISQPEETVSKTEYEELKHKLDVLKGKLDKEVPYYAEQNRFLMETIQKLEAENARRDQESKEKTKKTISKLEEDPVFKSLQESDPEMAKALSLTHEKTLETARQILQEYKEGTDAERQRDQTSRFQEKSSQFYGELADAGYPNINALYSNPDFQAFHHDLYRACGRGRWQVMEQQPGPVNWATSNQAPADGMVRLWTWLAYAHGCEMVSYFRWRQAPFAQEQMHAGLLRPVRVIAPEGSLVNARPPAAVAGGNVETSQRITDVLLGALAGLLAAFVLLVTINAFLRMLRHGSDSGDK